MIRVGGDEGFPNVGHVELGHVVTVPGQPQRGATSRRV
jgi:hypothetical protein